MGYRQVIIARKDLEMSAGKLSAQVSHASMAFLTTMIKNNINYSVGSIGRVFETYNKYETYPIEIDKDVFDEWINGIFTKTICEAKNKNQLMKAVAIAEELGLKENEDYFLIKDCCLTELEPEEYNEDNIGRVLTCIGFKPLPDEIAHKISKKFQLYK